MTTGISTEKDDRHLAEKLRTAGLRATRPRLLVLSVLDASVAHLSADDLVDELAARGTPLPRGSVYNVVGALVSSGLMMVTDIGPGRALYELAETWHHHFVCRECGRIEDVECVVGEKPCLDQDVANATIDEAQVIFRGTCSECQTARVGISSN
jgi:Fur family ferric uptake transcriptional regulator